MKKSLYKAEILLGLNVLLALSMLAISKLSTIYSLLILAYGIYRIFKNKNSDGSAHLFSAYIVGIEVLFRMNSGGFGYEYGKYAVMLFLICGLSVERKKKNIPVIFIVFMILFLPSIFLINYSSLDIARQEVSFNLSGPMCLGISVLYFYKRKFNYIQLKKILLTLLYPIIGMTIFIYFRTGSLESITFTTESNFQASGGFGPNQVSTVLGLGILIIAIAYFLGIQLFKIKYLNVFILLAFVIRGLATFSRGGMLAPTIAIIVCIIILSLTDSKFQARIGKIVYAFLIIFVLGFLGFNYVNDVSGGLLEKRFKGESMYDPERSNLYSGREEIFKEDLEVFSNNMMAGVGPGMASGVRVEMGGMESAAHIEYSRMLAEHGLFGVGAIIILIFFPINTFVNLKSINDKIILTMCVAFVFVTMGHAAMRTAVPGFIYGLAFINILRNKE